MQTSMPTRTVTKGEAGGDLATLRISKAAVAYRARVPITHADAGRVRVLRGEGKAIRASERGCAGSSCGERGACGDEAGSRQPLTSCGLCWLSMACPVDQVTLGAFGRLVGALGRVSWVPRNVEYFRYVRRAAIGCEFELADQPLRPRASFADEPPDVSPPRASGLIFQESCNDDSKRSWPLARHARHAGRCSLLGQAPALDLVYGPASSQQRVEGADGGRTCPPRLPVEDAIGQSLEI